MFTLHRYRTRRIRRAELQENFVMGMLGGGFVAAIVILITAFARGGQ